MYEYLFDQTYINLFVLALLLFLVMFLWRKVTIIEGNYFLLEKRVNIIKKEGREDLLAKNMERSEAVMNEIFRDSVTAKPCNNLNAQCKIPNNILTQNQYNLTEVTDVTDVIDVTDDTSCDFRNNIKGYAHDIVDIEDIVDITDIGDMVDLSINYFNISENKPAKTKASKIEIIKEPCIEPCVEPCVEQCVEPCDEILPDTVMGAQHTLNLSDVEPEEAIVTPIQLVNSGDICDITDTGSVCSDITFNSEDKSISKRYKNMNIEKLREECKEKSLNTEGNKAVLISRLVDSIKKQK